MTLDSSKFLDVNGYAVPLSMIASRNEQGVVLQDGRFFEFGSQRHAG